MSDTEAATSGAESQAIGITLGNTNASIAYTQADKATVIPNEDGGEKRVSRSSHQGHLKLTLTTIDRQIPAILSYVEGEQYYGQQAKDFLVRNPNNTVAYFRDFLGKE